MQVFWFYCDLAKVTHSRRLHKPNSVTLFSVSHKIKEILVFNSLWPHSPLDIFSLVFSTTASTV